MAMQGWRQRIGYGWWLGLVARASSRNFGYYLLIYVRIISLGVLSISVSTFRFPFPPFTVARVAARFRMNADPCISGPHMSSCSPDDLVSSPDHTPSSHIEKRGKPATAPTSQL